MKSSLRSSRSRWLHSAVLAPALFALLTAGCASVGVNTPVGEKPHPLDKAAWEGVWQNDREVLRVTVTDAAGGWLKIAGLRDKDGEIVLETQVLRVMESGDWLFGNVRSNEAGQPDRYLWFRLKLDGDQVVGWAPDIKKFRALVREGKLRGTLKDDDVELEPLTTAELAALTGGALGTPFEWDSPKILRRLAR